MVALNFMKQFADDVESGRTRRTIRAKRKDGRDPKAGQVLSLYTGMRSRGCRLLRGAVCSRVRSVLLTEEEVMLDGASLSPLQRAEFAKADGFDTIKGMRQFFRKAHGLPFAGNLIEW